jgi:hypothetical protein
MQLTPPQSAAPRQSVAQLGVTAGAVVEQAMEATTVTSATMPNERGATEITAA